MKKCELCHGNEILLRHPRVRDNEELQVLECVNCGLVFLSSFKHISEEFYEKSGMLNGQVNLKKYRQHSYKDDQRRADELREKVTGKRVLDFGCGAGGFLHLIKEFAEEAAGVELDEHINASINGEGIQCFKNISKVEGKYDVITLFHVLEHLVNPKYILNQLKHFLSEDGSIIIEVPNADDALLTLYKSREFADFTYWSCHVYLYNAYTLKLVVEQAGFKVKLIKQIQRYPLSNHLYWLSNNSPGGHKEWNFLNSHLIDSEYENMLASIGKCDTLLTEISL